MHMKRPEVDIGSLLIQCSVPYSLNLELINIDLNASRFNKLAELN